MLELMLLIALYQEALEDWFHLSLEHRFSQVSRLLEVERCPWGYLEAIDMLYYLSKSLIKQRYYWEANYFSLLEYLGSQYGPSNKYRQKNPFL